MTDPTVVLGPIFLDDTTKGDDAEPLEETPFEKVRHAVWETLYADDAGGVSGSRDDRAGMMAEVVATCREFGLTVSESKTEVICPW